MERTSLAGRAFDCILLALWVLVIGLTAAALLVVVLCRTAMAWRASRVGVGHRRDARNAV